MNSELESTGETGEERDQVRQRAWKFLSVREHSAHELRQKLLRKGFSGETVAEVLTDLTREGYLDDREYGRRLLERRIHQQGYGRHYALREMLEKGLDLDTASSLLEEISEDMEREKAWEIGSRKLSALRRLGVEDPLPAVGRHLHRRGFSGALVRRVLEELFHPKAD